MRSKIIVLLLLLELTIGWGAWLAWLVQREPSVTGVLAMFAALGHLVALVMAFIDLWETAGEVPDDDR